jgi:hypothetical protein
MRYLDAQWKLWIGLLASLSMQDGNAATMAKTNCFK